MELPKKLRVFLEENHVEYTHTVHPLACTAREVASAEHLPSREVAKTVVAFGARLVDFQEVRLTLGLTHARLAAEEEIARLFPDCEMGAMPPLGNLYGMPVNVQPRHALSHRAHADGRLPQASPPRSHFVGAGGCGVARVVIRRECRAVAGWTRQLSDTPPTVGGTWPERAFPDNWEREVYFAATATLTVWTQRDEMG